MEIERHIERDTARDRDIYSSGDSCKGRETTIDNNKDGDRPGTGTLISSWAGERKGREQEHGEISDRDRDNNEKWGGDRDSDSISDRDRDKDNNRV